MKNILCFGDSNTWGYAPCTGDRYPYQVRWTGVLQQTLGSEYHVIEEGLNGRTTMHDQAERAFRNGIALLPVLLECHRPLDLVVVMLGTNDLKIEYALSASQIAQGAKSVCETILNHEFIDRSKTQILLVSPTVVATMSEQDEAVFAGAVATSRQFCQHYQLVTESLGIHFFDAAKIVATTDSDGIHWEAEQHVDFGHALGEMIKQVLSS